MKERPILMSAPMVRAILAGTKTQTRRVVRHPNIADVEEWAPPTNEDPRWELGYRPTGGAGASLGHVRCPYGGPGDRLWVRETWGLHIHTDYTCWNRDSIRGRSPEDLACSWALAYAADATSVYDFWRPSIHMPRWASRITLDVTSVRVERLQDITEEDARAEGVEPMKGVGADQPIIDVPRRGRTQGTHPHVLAFAVLWDTINGKRAHWQSNPWVWVISFRRVDQATRAA